MDSGNSGSMQSSSGCDEEFDSHPPGSSSSSSSFSLQYSNFLDPSSNLFLSNSNPNPNSSLLSISHQPSLFDPSSTYLHSLSHPPNPNSLLNLDLVRPVNPRSLISSDLGDPVLLPSSSSSSGQPMLHPGRPLPPSSSSPSMQDFNGVRRLAPSDQTTNVVKNPKKRTRASRRAPTTVLTTDTTNFRAMVQEFTGVPAPPFAGPSSYSRRLDLFGLRPSQLDSMGSLFNLRPSSTHQKVSNSSSLLDGNSGPSNSTNNNTINATSVATTVNAFNSGYNLPREAQNMQPLMQNQGPISQPLMQPPSLPSFVGARSQGSLGTASFEGLGMGHGVNLLGGLNSTNDDHVGGSDRRGHDHLRPYKGLENVASRGEGTSVDSWICPSD